MTSSPSHAPQSALQAAIGACTSSFLLVFAYSCGFNLLLLAPSIYLLQIYDRVLSSRSLDTLVMLTLMVAVAVIVGGILDVVRRAALSRIGGWFDDRLRPLVLAACLEYAYRVSPARANEAYRDLGTLRQFIESPLFALLFDLLWAPFFLVVLFMVHPLLGMIGVLCVILLFGFALAGELATRAPLAEAASAQARSHGRLWAMLNNIQVIKAMGMTEGAARLVYGETGAIQNALETVARRTERIQAFARPLRAVVQVLMMGTAAWLVLEEHRSPGIIFVTSLLFGRALAPVEGVVAGWRTFGAVRDAYRRLTDTLAAVAPALVERRSALPNPEGRLAVDNVSFCPPGRGNFLLRGISFPLNPGECLGVIGPSGAGKSLLGRLIAGVATPTIGRVTLDSVDVALWREARGG
jgi:ATP-binding cassette subfamily C protein